MAGARTIVVADDHPVALNGLVGFLGECDDVQVVGQAANGIELLELVAETNPDLVITDLKMPKLGEKELLQRLFERFPRCKCLVVSVCDNQENVCTALRMGANGYLLKDASPWEYRAAMEAALKGQVYLSPQIASMVVRNSGDAPNGATDGAGDAPQLTKREREVLRLVADGLHNKEIAEALGISTRTIESHRERISAKLDMHGVAALTKYAIREGIATL